MGRKQTQNPDRTGPRCAVVGAGIAGLSAARVLHEAGYAVRVFDKARGPGGRMSARRVESGSFDHGAQYFTARTTEFRAALQLWCRQGLVAPWPRRVLELQPDGRRSTDHQDHQRFVAVPRMSALPRALSDGLDVRYGIRVGRLEPADDRVSLRDDEDRPLGAFDSVLVTAPLPQAAVLLASAPLVLPAGFHGVAMQPCWAALLTLPECAVPFDAVRLHDDSTLAWLAHDSGKPGRDSQGGVQHFVAHATPAWSRAWLEATPEQVAAELCRHLGERLPELPRPLKAVAHRWRYARVPAGAAGAEYGVAPGAGRIWLAGDSVAGRSRVEDAWLSGRRAAGRIVARGRRGAPH